MKVQKESLKEIVSRCALGCSYAPLGCVVVYAFWAAIWQWPSASELVFWLFSIGFALFAGVIASLTLGFPTLLLLAIAGFDKALTVSLSFGVIGYLLSHFIVGGPNPSFGQTATLYMVAGFASGLIAWRTSRKNNRGVKLQ